jgi:hypothetical protein
MKQYELDSTPAKRAFKSEIERVYGDKSFTVKEGKSALKSSGYSESKWDSIYLVLRKACNVGRGVYSISQLGNNVIQDGLKKESKKEKKDIIKNDLKIINEKEDVPVPEYYPSTPPVVKESKKTPNTVMSLIPKKLMKMICLVGFV